MPRDASPEFVDSSGEESNAKSSNNGEIIASQFYGNSRKDREKKLLSLQAERKLKASRSATAEELSDDDSARVRAPSGRTTRSKGIKEVKMLSYKKGATEYSDDDGIVVSDIHPRATRKSTRNVRQTTRAASAAAQRRKPRRSADSSEYESDDGRTRRSGRTKRVKPSYAEPELDDDFAGIDVEVKKKPRVIHAKEIFPVLDEDDEFVMVHNKVCGVCKTLGHSRERGKLICCQGCSTSYHKDCLGIRAGREHLVTKISDENFVLQCKRCIGKARIKDPLQAYFDKCSTCHVQGLSCAPFKALTEKKKATTQDSREVTADTHVPNDLLYNAENVLFRCDGCYRAWHYEHLPQRGSKRGRTGSDDVHKERIEQYTKDFMCVECNSTPEKIGTVVAWRPVDEVSRQEVTSLDLGDFNEDEREYLVRFEGDSYFHVRWMPGPWIAGAHPLKKMGFLKHDPPAILTEEEAIKEEWVRVEIVLDVEYTSIVPSGAIVDVDLARIKEVRRALVKYKGLGYEDVFWDEPPKETDTERWADWRRAYDDYIHGLFIKPAKGTTKKVEKARRTPFANLEMQGQPSYIKGGTLMDYQKEGMK